MLLSRHTMIGLAVLGATSAEGEGTSRVSVHKPGLHTKLDGSLWRTRGKHGRVAAVPRTLVKGLFSEPRRDDASCGRAWEARPQELFSTAAFCYDMLDSQRATKLQQFPHKRESVVFPRVRRGGNERDPRDQGAGRPRETRRVLVWSLPTPPAPE